MISKSWAGNVILLVAMLASAIAWQQPAPESTGSQLAAENAYYRATRIQLEPKSVIPVPPHGNDVVVILPGPDAVQLTSGPVAQPIELKDGDVRFLDRKQHFTLQNAADTAVQVLVVELRQHWDSEIRICSEFAKCSRAIRMGNLEIGETTSLFTNGFVTAYRHRLVSRGTLTSSYFSSRGKSHLLLIPLTDLRANFDGIDEELKGGQVYPSDAVEVEVTASDHEIRWIVIRVQDAAAK